MASIIRHQAWVWFKVASEVDSDSNFFAWVMSWFELKNREAFWVMSRSESIAIWEPTCAMSWYWVNSWKPLESWVESYKSPRCCLSYELIQINLTALASKVPKKGFIKSTVKLNVRKKFIRNWKWIVPLSHELILINILKSFLSHELISITIMEAF